MWPEPPPSQDLDHIPNQVLDLADRLMQLPRHLGIHPGGMVLCDRPVIDMYPVEWVQMPGRTVLQWDKDDCADAGLVKFDLLGLGMLSALKYAFGFVRETQDTDLGLHSLPQADPAVYDLLCAADTVGVFQVESRAQMATLPRLRPRTFYDIVIEVALIRPGPIQGGSVHPYISRKRGREPVTYLHPLREKSLGKTLGVPLFQEQAMQIAIVGAGFTPEQADRLRRSLATFKKHGNVSEFRTLFMRGMRNKGYDADFAERCFSQIEGFGSYGFPESHAASFALLVYASAWIKHHHPGIFACALLNSQPMGFYAPAQIVRDAREHGVIVRPVCINASFWDNTMEPDAKGGLALRLGFRQIKGLNEEDASWIAAGRGNGYQSVNDLWRRAGLDPAIIARLAEADTFREIGLSRRQALWEAKALTTRKTLPLFDGDIDGEAIHEPAAHLPQMTEGEQVVEDYVAMRLSLRRHPVALLRHILTPMANRTVQPYKPSHSYSPPDSRALPIPITRTNPD